MDPRGGSFPGRGDLPTERDFRAKKNVAPSVQACYEILSNQIFLYESSDRDEEAPEVASLRRPQTVAHEGTHQILANIGVQPRLSSWPMWLVEGLAEYCSPPATGRKGRVAWKGLGEVNSFHMATIRDLADPLTLQAEGANAPRIGREPGQPLVEYVVAKADLSPTDYALAWAVTHYLAQKRKADFVDYLKTMSQVRPMENHSPDDHLASFRKAFGGDLKKMDRAIAVHLKNLKYDQLPYFSVIFEQPVGGQRLRRMAMVSQSPSMIQQWLADCVAPNGGEPRWEVVPQPSRGIAKLEIQRWIYSQQ